MRTSRIIKINDSNTELGVETKEPDVVETNELKDIPQALQTTLKSFVNKGGNVVVIPAQESNVNAMNSFLSNFGPIQLKASISSDKKVTKINFNHPLFSNVFEKKRSIFDVESKNCI